MTWNGQNSTSTPAVERAPVAVLGPAGTIRIGRDPGNDIVLPDLWVSGKHAEIRRSGGEAHLVDLGSTNGVHLNGKRVPRGVLTAGDRFTVGRHEFLFDGAHLFQHDDQGPTSFVADDITVDIGKANLLDDVSFALHQGSLLGIIGPSGCGKSTLVKAMTGFQKPTRGGLLYDGRDLYENYSELRHRIGMVPQDDVLHRQLTVQRALRFAAALRFADDVPRKQRRERVGEVIELLGLQQRAKQRIDTLSGGQRKRTSVALELLTEPSLLALDEPTSGLDPALDKEVMRELRLLADRGRTVVVVTHSVLHLDICDYVMVLCMGGRMGYFGPPDELLGFFGSEDYADVFHKVTHEPQRWAHEFRASEIYRRYVGDVAQELARAKAQESGAAVPAPRSAATAGSAIDDEALAPAVEEPVLAAATAPVAVAVGTPAVDDV
ncbi:MAG: ATP-binding cassette domain-containing protein, partial [Hamadaea sp.]|nr:ATP-binding cassette domain-containing protein [Hamadaea sp.]